MRRLSFLGALSLLTLSCSSGGAPPSSDGPEGELRSPIIGGVLDSAAHPAVVAVLDIPPGSNSFGACTGTIFKIDVAKNVGWVITAGHCVGLEGLPGNTVSPPSEMYVVTGDDYSTAIPPNGGSRVHKVLDLATPATGIGDPPAHDIAILKFAGVTAATPVLPLTTADLDADLAAGEPMDIVGYGKTSGANNNSNSRKYKLLNHPLSGNQSYQDTVTHKIVTYHAVDVGTIGALVGPNGENTCQGDSGGPWFRTISGQEYVTGITSVGAPGCATQGAVAVRVSSELSFINNFVDGGSGTGGAGGATQGAGGAPQGAGGDTTVGAGGDPTGAGGDTSAGAGGDTSVGAGGDPTGAGGTDPTGTGGTGTAGTGTAGTGTGGTGTAAGGTGTTTGTGGKSTVAGAGGSSVGASGTAGAGGFHGLPPATFGFGGAPVMSNPDSATDASSGSSGGCSVPGGSPGLSGMSLLLAVGLAARARRKRA